MKKMQAKTLIEKAGFVDLDKKSNNHDAIQLWVYNNAKEVLSNLPYLKNKEFEISHRIWEYVVENEPLNQFQQKSIVGFVDLCFVIDVLEFSEESKSKYKSQKNVYVEIKTEIPSVGDLFRQLKVYKKYLRDYFGIPILVVCPNDTYKDLINEQGFYFYKYNDPKYLF